MPHSPRQSGHTMRLAKCTQAPGCLDERRRERADQLDHRFIADRCVFLREKAHLGPPLKCNLTAIGRCVIEVDGKEGGLPGTVSADHTDAIPAINLQTGICKQRSPGVGLRDTLDGQHRFLCRALSLHCKITGIKPLYWDQNGARGVI